MFPLNLFFIVPTNCLYISFNNNGTDIPTKEYANHHKPLYPYKFGNAAKHTLGRLKTLITTSPTNLKERKCNNES